MDIKKLTYTQVPVRMLDATTGAPVIGLPYSALTIYLAKAGGASIRMSIHQGDWAEIDSTNMPGVYRLQFSPANTDTTGILIFSVAAPDADTFIGSYGVTNGLTDDIYKFLTGRYRIDVDMNTFTVYDTDDYTPLKIFIVKDAAGTPNATSIFERT